MNILIDILEGVIKSLGTIKVESNNRFGLPILFIRSRSHYLMPDVFNGILTRDEAKEAYESHINFLDAVGDETIERINKLKNDLEDGDFNGDDLLNKIEEINNIENEMINSVSAKVYLIKCGNEYKIGFSSNPNSRINGVVAPHGNGNKKELILTIDNNYPRGLESFLHGVFSHKHISGEWYSLNEIDIEWISQSIPYLQKRDFGRGNILGL